MASRRVLGLSVLSGYRALIDFPAKTVYLLPATPAVTVKTAAPGSKPANAK